LDGLKYVAQQLISNGKIENSDWVNAANIYMPATHAGSNFSVAATVAPVPGGGGVIEANYVTTKKGEFQLFLTHGEGLSSQGASIGYAMGIVEGKFTQISDFTGKFAQASIGYNSSSLVGGSVSGWGGLTGGKPELNGVWGYDFAATLGFPGGSGSIVYGEAIPAQEAVKRLLDKFNASDTEIGKKYIDYAEKVSYRQLSGFGLFVCRAANQCGRSWAQ
jgi:hypothetical protein